MAVRIGAGVALAAVTVVWAGAVPAQGIDPRVLQSVQGQLGVGQPSASQQLDASRSVGAQVGTSQTGIVNGSGGLAITPEELQLRRIEAQRELDDLYQPSPVERDFRQRLTDPTLRQFGYELFQSAQAATGSLTGAVGDDYVLGIGDELIVSLQGATNDTRTVRVDREGRVVVGALRPVQAAGRTLGALRSALAAETRRTLLGTDVVVSVGSVRAISIFVGGEVARPGQYNTTSLADVVSALALAGGPRRSGSLRQVRVQRAGGGVVSVDLYGALGIGAAQTVRLRDGDRVIVPVIGRTIAVAGSVARPGIYELRGPVTVEQAVGFAGGPLRPRGSRVSISRIAADGSEEFVRALTGGSPVQAGDALQVVGASAGGALNRVVLRGFVANPGPRPLAATPTVRALVGDRSDLRSGTYLPLAALIRTDVQTGSRLIEGVNLTTALADAPAVPLRSDDRLYLFSRADVAFINSAAIRRIVLGRPNPLRQCRALDNLAALVADVSSNRFSAVTRGTFVIDRGGRTDVAATGAVVGQGNVRRADETLRANDTVQAFGDASQVGTSIGTGTGTDVVQGGFTNRQDTTTRLDTAGRGDQTGRTPAQQTAFGEAERDRAAACPAVFEEEPELLPFLIENAVVIGGAVRQPGAYPLAGSLTAAEAAAVAGGITGGGRALTVDVTAADAEVARSPRVQVTLATAPAVRPGDDIRFNGAAAQYESSGVLLTGEVNRPGLYAIRKGETLRQLIERAGGLNELAYPYGTVFTRRAVKEQQEESFRRTARDLNAALVTAVTRRSGTSLQGLSEAGQLVSQLARTESPGRVVLEADPRVLAARPELDTVLEGGDSIFVPKRPNFVLVLGDVASPGAQQFASGKAIGDYVREAGGLSQSADRGRTYLVLPDGSARPVARGRFGGADAVIPPGSVIIVPRNIDPLFRLEFFRDIATIFGQIATPIATIAVLATR